MRTTRKRTRLRTSGADKVCEAEDFLTRVLSHGPVAVADLRVLADEADISFDGAVKDAKFNLGVKSIKMKKCGGVGPWLWTMGG